MVQVQNGNLENAVPKFIIIIVIMIPEFQLKAVLVLGWFL